MPFAYCREELDGPYDLTDRELFDILQSTEVKCSLCGKSDGSYIEAFWEEYHHRELAKRKEMYMLKRRVTRLEKRVARLIKNR